MFLESRAQKDGISFDLQKLPRCLNSDFFLSSLTQFKYFSVESVVKEPNLPQNFNYFKWDLNNRPLNLNTNRIWEPI